MMTAYILKLLVLLPLVAGLAFAALWLWRKVQPGLAMGQRDRMVKTVDAVPMGATGRLAVVEFGGKRLLLAVSRGRIELLSEAPIPEFRLPQEAGDDA
jgi:flagellar protein FliO/FliZ